MIHVCFGLSDKDGRYSKFTGTAILSMFENTFAEVTVHILHDNTLSNDNRDKFSYIAGRYGQIIKFYNVEEICVQEIERLKKIFENYPHFKGVTFGSFYRILSSQIIPDDIEKIIYLDSDLIVNLDISEFWQVQMGDKILAGAPEVANGVDPQDFRLIEDGFVYSEEYFNAGVLIMNLKQIRQNYLENIINGMKFVARNHQYSFFDQDVLNYCFSKLYLKLPIKFNFFSKCSRQRGEFQTDNRICHYAGHALDLDISDNFNKLWFSYFEKTPWFTKDVIGSLDESYRQIVNKREAGLKNFAAQLTALISGKTRAFFTTAQNVDAIKKFFLVHGDEEIIPLVNRESFNELVKSMRESLGKKVFFIFFEGYFQLCADLMKMGFVEGRDFINAAMFLTNANGSLSKDESYQLVRNI